jgi:multidrug efflux pump subunit AcrA (membrane-fusion protein)
MSASARVELDRLADVLVVPTGAVFQHGSASVVYVVNGGSMVSRPINVLRRGRDQIAVASGVHEGERVSLREPEQEGAAK